MNRNDPIEVLRTWVSCYDAAPACGFECPKCDKDVSPSEMVAAVREVVHEHSK